MAKKKTFNISRDLANGISQTITTAKNNVGQLRYEMIPVTRIKLDPDNPRKLFILPEDIIKGLDKNDPNFVEKSQEQESLNSLAESIKKVGVRLAVEVYKEGSDYKLISGERRYLASLIAGKLDIPARILETKPTEFDLRFLQWIENIEREDLSAWERIENIRQITQSYQLLNQTTVNTSSLSDILGCSRQQASNYLSALNAPNIVHKAMQDGVINSIEKAAVIAKETDLNKLAGLINACQQGMSLNDLKQFMNIQVQTSSSNRKTLSKKAKGRPLSRISMGYTNKTSVIERIIHSVMKEEEYSQFRSQFSDMNVANPVKLNKMFQQFIKLMETVEK